MKNTNLVLKTAIGNYGHTQALKEAAVSVSGAGFDFIEVTPVYKAFRTMIQQEAFDVSEMAFTTYMLAKSFNKKLTALPVVLMRIFHHGTIMCNRKSGIHEPKDLEGKRVGVRAYAQTGPTWSRGILQDDYGVRLNKVTWVTYEDSHVAEYKDPENTVRAPEGKSLKDMLIAGEIDAAISPRPIISPEVKPLFDEAASVEAQWFKKRGVYPINHIVVVKESLAASHPWVLRALFEAFKTAKETYLKALYADGNGPKSKEDELRLRLKRIVGGDPLPYGIGPNRKAVETLAKFAFDQKMLPTLFKVEELFDPAVMDFE